MPSELPSPVALDMAVGIAGDTAIPSPAGLVHKHVLCVESAVTRVATRT